MTEIREPWASGFGYGGLAKKIYCRDRSRVPMRQGDRDTRTRYLPNGALSSFFFLEELEKLSKASEVGALHRPYGWSLRAVPLILIRKEPWKWAWYLTPPVIPR